MAKNEPVSDLSTRLDQIESRLRMLEQVQRLREVEGALQELVKQVRAQPAAASSVELLQALKRADTLLGSVCAEPAHLLLG